MNKYWLESFYIVLLLGLFACNSDVKREEVYLSSEEENTDQNFPNARVDSLLKLTMSKDVILTGIHNHRLLGIYRAYAISQKNKVIKVSDEEIGEYEIEKHYLPGFDLFYGYQMINILNYNIEKDSSNLFFEQNVLIKNLYFPSFDQDSLNDIPVNRNYYLVSVFDKDTNKDQIINQKDLRHFFWVNADASHRTQVIPDNYSVVRSEYDSKNDVLFIYATEDTNKNGQRDNFEPLRIFWLSLKIPSTGTLII